jgi:hypothetical protein
MRHWLQALLIPILAGCEVHIKIGNPGAEPEWKKKPWVAWATQKKTGQVEFWWSYYESRDDCVRGVSADVRGVQSNWYGEPAGCAYRGSDVAPWLYLMNRIYASAAMECVAVLKSPGTSGEHVVVARGAARETSTYRCKWG